MLKFDNDSIYTGHIKQLLNEFNLPSCPVYKQGMKVFKDHIYIVDGYIAKALETKVPTNIESFKKYDLYIYNKPYLNITKNFPINYIEGINSIEYANLLHKVRISSKIRNFMLLD